MREEIAKRIIGKAKAAFGAACFGALYFLVKYETEFNAPFIWAFKHLTLPICLVMLVVAIFFHRSCRELFGKIGCIWKGIILTPILKLLCGPFVSAVNAIFPPQRQELIEGLLSDNIQEWKNLLSNGQYVCGGCKRIANSSENLCDPQEL